MTYQQDEEDMLHSNGTVAVSNYLLRVQNICYDWNASNFRL